MAIGNWHTKTLSLKILRIQYLHNTSTRTDYELFIRLVLISKILFFIFFVIGDFILRLLKNINKTH